jgi:DNA-binding ferritin-like protein
MRTRHNKNHNKTKKNKGRKTISTSTLHSMEKFQKEITLVFFEMLLMIKLYHWKTTSYAAHKASDELYSSLNSNIDKFIEVLLGKTGERIDLLGTNTLKLKNLSEISDIKKEVNDAKQFLVSLDKSSDMKIMYNSDLFNIRDEILGDLNQFLYLLTFK